MIVDVWERLRPAESNRHGARRLYSLDYAPLAKLKALCEEFDGLAVLVLHHTSKREMENFTDPLDLVSGTTGLTGAVDNVLMLVQQRGQLILLGRGREIEGFAIPVELDVAGGRGLVLANPMSLGRSPSRWSLMMWLAEQGPAHEADIAVALKRSASSIRNHLAEEPALHRDEDGRIALDEVTRRQILRGQEEAT